MMSLIAKEVETTGSWIRFETGSELCGLVECDFPLCM